MLENPITDKRQRIAHNFEELDRSPNTPKSKSKKWRFILIIFACVGGLIIWMSQESEEANQPIFFDQDGTPHLSPERKAKLEQELDEIDNAEQYALITVVNGYFPCFSCMDGSTTIFLKKGEVWRYGVTRKGEKIRYPAGKFGAGDLYYVPQFKGDYAACLKEEKRKIYYYPTLPEAIMRPVKLIRPPGNKTDR